MRLWLDGSECKSRAIARVVRALAQHAPQGVDIVGTAEEADFIVLQVTGRLERLKRRIAHYGKPYVLVQHAFKSTQHPDPADWQEVWQGARLVWSHYDLPTYNLYRSALGVDKDFFYCPDVKQYEVLTTGTYLTEGVRECLRACEGLGRAIHLGGGLTRTLPHVERVEGIPDAQLAVLYGQTRYVSGLRRMEGFELPAAEGLVCGARPILYDQPHYRHWYGNMAEYIPEGPREEVLEALKDLMRGPYQPVTESESETARQRFDWGKIVQGFYDYLGVSIPKT